MFGRLIYVLYDGDRQLIKPPIDDRWITLEYNLDDILISYLYVGVFGGFGW